MMQLTSIAVCPRETSDTADDSTDDQAIAVNCCVSCITPASGEARLTSDTPLASEVLINVGDDWTNDQSGDLGASVQSSDLGRTGVAKILMPSIESLQTGDDAALVCLMSTGCYERYWSAYIH